MGIYVRNRLLPLLEDDLPSLEVDLRFMEEKLPSMEEVFLKDCRDFVQEHPAFDDPSLY